MARVLALLVACALSGSLAARASAQGGARVCVVRVDPAHEWIARDLEEALSGMEAGMQVVPDPGHFDEARRSGFDPGSEAALARLMPSIGVDLALVPRVVELDALALELRDGRSGQSLGLVQVPLESGALGPEGRSVLIGEVSARLVNVASSGEGGVEGGAVGAEDVFDDEGAAPDPASDAATLQASLAVGVGVGSRSVDWPVPAGRQIVDTGAFPAIGARVAIEVVPEPAFSIGPALEYQTSVGHEVDEQHVGGVAYPMAIRSHHFEGSLVPTLRLGERRRFRLWAALGYGVRDLMPEVHHLLTPSFSLSGPVLRLGARIPIVAETLEVVVVPELQWIALVGEDLEERDVNASGWGLGGHAGLEVGVGGGFFVVLSYREAHALLGTRLGRGATDVERYATFGVLREL